MKNSLEFNIYEQDSIVSGVFTPVNEDSWLNTLESFHNNLDLYQFHEISPQDFAFFCEGLLKSEPLFFDSYAHLGMLLFDSRPDLAAKWYKKGFELGLTMLPDNFSGQISWSHLGNRPFLRCHHGHIISLIKKRKFKQAISEINKHLQWNENDNIGVRYLVGELYMLVKNFSAAEDIMDKNADGHPPYYYSLGLLAFLRKNYAKAITYFRRGILANPYLAEIITGRKDIISRKFWHSSSLMFPDLAIDFMANIGEQLWQKNEKAKIFLDWVLNCSLVLNERSEFVKCRELLQVEHDFNRRRDIRKIEEQLIKDVSDETSQNLVKRIVIRGEESWPWEAVSVTSFWA